MSDGGSPGTYAYYEATLGDAGSPCALVDLDAMWHNAADAIGRARGKPIRVASKSVRCRALLRAILNRDPAFRGLMTFTLAESLWLHDEGFDDLLLAYPTTDREALFELARHDHEGRPIVMVDSPEHLDFITAAVESGPVPIRVCIDLDCGYRPAGGRIRIGPKRSPVHDPGEAASLARQIISREGFVLAGLMGYEGHIAGVVDRPLGNPAMGFGIRQMKRASVAELTERRAAVVAAVREVEPVPLVNAGGTGSLETTRMEDVVTEVTVGSGFYAPTLFDRYDAFELRPAAMYAMPVVRRPGPGVATVLGGGYPASGAAGRDRLPQPHLPKGLTLDSMEGAGEVQTPVVGEAADRLRIGDRVYFRHAKAGELCERFDTLKLIADGEVVDEVPTYRGEGKTYL